MAVRDERVPAPPQGIYPNVPMDEYLAWDAWSRSDIAAMMVSPEFCYWHRNDKPQKQTDATAFGTLAHIALLEPHLWPPKGYAVIDGPMNRNPWKKEAADAKERGFEIVKKEALDRCEALVARCRRDDYIGGLLDMSEGEREVAAVAQCPQTGLWLKARCDLRVPSLRVIGDLKTTGKGTDPVAWQRMLWEYGYWMGAPHYIEVFGWAEGQPYESFLFLVTSQTAPFLPRNYHLDPITTAAGQDMNHYLRRRVAACLDSGEWPASESRIDSCGLNTYRLNQISAILEGEAQK